ncbi:MAG: RNA-processing protein [Methanoregulaceae archaeon]|jgi:nucleolar protein 56|nr:RNA-processing protein [Methanoregulaceae archaeon]MCU0629259.1 RNA-processing protein [Methanoregulaceae archaeon]
MPRDPGILVEWVQELAGSGVADMPEWEWAVQCGFVKDRSEYLDILHTTAMHLAGILLERELKADHPELILMVKMLDQIDSVINLLSERAVEWYRVLNPEFSRKSALPQGRKLRDLMREGSVDALREILDEIDQLAERRSLLAKRVSAKAAGVLPNCSALSGGLVAARLAAEAGGIRNLSMMPGSAIQVLGARNALFCHLATGSPPPKHGLVYQYSGVHGSRKEKRGKVARTLAAKLAIAARIDYYRGELDPMFITKAKEAIRSAGRGP